MIFYIVAIIIFLYLIFDFKKGFMLFLGLKYLLVTNITVLSIPGIPILSLDDMLTMLVIAVFFIKKRNVSRAKISFPWATPFILLSFVWIISAIFAKAGVIPELSTLLDHLVQEVMIIWIIWEVVEDREDFALLFNIITILTFVSCIYGFYEYSIGNNPLSAYEATLNNDETRVVDFSYNATTIRGYRVNSVFSHAIGAGVNWAMYIVFVGLAYTQFNEMKVKSIPSIMTALLCVPGIILTKQRAGIFFLIIGILACVNFKRKRFYAITLIGIVAIVLMWPIIQLNLAGVISIFTGAGYSGSDAATRFDQFAAALELLKLSPITGLGEKFSVVYNNLLVDRLLGLESIWIKVVVVNGLLGVVSYSILIWFSVITIPRYYKSKSMMLVAIAYWLTYSLTSLPGVHTYLFYLIMIYCVKKSNVYKSISGDRINEWSIQGWKIHYRSIYKLQNRK